MANHIKTPLLQNLRTSGGTLYVFPSASEDIGLNLNNRANTVSLSHYALLDIPVSDTLYDETDAHYIDGNRFNPTLIPGHFEYVVKNSQNVTANGDKTKPSWHIAASLQNYAMNFETLLMNQDSYNFQDLATVSERVFWKWLKETGAIRWKAITKDATTTSLLGYVEGDVVKDSLTTVDSSYYNKVVRCFGSIDSGNSLSTEFAIFNETYINVPSSYGGGKVFFKTVRDDSTNYILGHYYYVTNNLYLEGRNSDDNDLLKYTVNLPFTDNALQVNSADTTVIIDGKEVTTKATTEAYITEDYEYSAETIDSINSSVLYVYNPQDEGSSKVKYLFKRSNLDGVEIVKEISDIQSIWKSWYGATDAQHNAASSIVSFDTLNTDETFIPDQQFDFNAILLYYSIYDTTTNANKSALATNLFGVLFLDSPVIVDSQHNTGAQTSFKIVPLTKKKSNVNGFGTGYSFRVNVKTLSVYDNSDSIINDSTTSNSLISEDFNTVVHNLAEAANAINANTNIINSISEQYAKIIAFNGDHQSDIADLSTKLNAYIHGDRTEVLDTSLIKLNAVEAKGNSVEFYIPTGNSSINTSTYSKVAVIDKDGLHTTTLDSSAVKTLDSYINITKMMKFDGQIYNSADSYKPYADIDKFLKFIFEPTQATDKSYYYGLNILATQTYDNYKVWDADTNAYIDSSKPNFKLYVDPDSPLLNQLFKFEDTDSKLSAEYKTKNKYWDSKDLRYLLVDKTETVDADDTSTSVAGNIEYIKMVPMIIAYIQAFNSAFASKVSDTPIIASLNSSLIDHETRIGTLETTVEKQDYVTKIDSLNTSVNKLEKNYTALNTSLGIIDLSVGVIWSTKDQDKTAIANLQKITQYLTYHDEMADFPYLSMAAKNIMIDVSNGGYINIGSNNAEAVQIKNAIVINKLNYSVTPYSSWTTTDITYEMASTTYTYDAVNDFYHFAIISIYL